MFMPSSVMLIALFGSPLTVELRAVPEVLKPASDVNESSALRLLSGRLTICKAVRLVAIDGVCVWTTSALSPVTVTFSSSVPTASVTLTLAGIAAFKVTSFNTAVLNPMSATVTEYVPPGSDGIVKPPSLADTVLNSAPVPLFFTLTSAPGMTPPDESTTVPESDVKKLPCACAALATPTITRTAAKILKSLDFIKRSLLEKTRDLREKYPVVCTCGSTGKVSKMRRQHSGQPWDPENRTAARSGRVSRTGRLTVNAHVFRGFS